MSNLFYFYLNESRRRHILNQKEPFRTILLHLQVVIEATLPKLQMLYKYKIPFYYVEGKRPFCFMGASQNYVDLGFWHGAHLTKHEEHLVSKGRKHMKSLRYFAPEEVDEEVLVNVLLEAYSHRDRKYYK